MYLSGPCCWQYGIVSKEGLNFFSIDCIAYYKLISKCSLRPAVYVESPKLLILKEEIYILLRLLNLISKFSDHAFLASSYFN
jgi:hypothetical protein